MTLKEAREKLEAKRAELKTIFDQAGPDMDMAKVDLPGDSKAKVEAIQAKNKELNDLNDELQKLRSLDESRKALAGMDTTIGKQSGPIEGKMEDKPRIKTLGEAFLETKARENKNVDFDVPGLNVKTLMEASAGWDPENVRSGRVSLYPEQALGVLDYIPLGNYQGDLYKFMLETTKTAGATAVAEGGAYGEAAFAYTETSHEVEKIGAWLPITDEQLEDNPGLRDLINQRLTYCIKAKLESYVLVGTGTTPQIWGANSLAAVQTQAKSTDPTPDAVHKAITKVRVTGFAEPSVIFAHPNDWQDIRLLRTADGIYVYGSPMDATPARMWGVPVVQTTFQTENTAMVGDFARYCTLFMRQGIRFAVTNSHDTNFINGKQAIRADIRAVSVFYRETAFCTVTGI
jgi:HK97 family phage major capsid protein